MEVVTLKNLDKEELYGCLVDAEFMDDDYNDSNAGPANPEDQAILDGLYAHLQGDTDRYYIGWLDAMCKEHFHTLQKLGWKLIY